MEHRNQRNENDKIFSYDRIPSNESVLIRNKAHKAALKKGMKKKHEIAKIPKHNTNCSL